jgi:lipopolysaccharide/colanic/teichoic acid biosynthesis glycosyltransferase
MQYTVKRIFDTAIALFILAAASPVLLIAAAGIKLTSPGPVLYRARRIGKDRRRQQRHEPYRGREFTMYKLRTMRTDRDTAALPITAWEDSRVFPWGRLLRRLKIDELPQLVNVIKGNMSLVGPRPEAPEVVHSHYREDDVSTLRVHPGVTSPGTLYYYTHCEALLSSDAVMNTYVGRVLPIKLALDRVYLTDASLLYDMRVLLRTMNVIFGRGLGVRRFSDPPELRKARVDTPQ